MLYHLLFPLADQFPALNVIRYLTFRTGGAVLTALLLSFLLGPPLIRWLKSKQTNGQPIRDDGPQAHIVKKQGTPTMGGVLILVALGIGTLLWADLANPYVWITLFVTFGFGAVGNVPSGTAWASTLETRRNPQRFSASGTSVAPVPWRAE